MENFLLTLPMMLKGMGVIFLVILLMYLVISLLKKIF